MCAQTLPPPPPAAQGCCPQRARVLGGGPQGLAITASVGLSGSVARSLHRPLSAADPPAPPPSASTATSALPDTRHGAGAALGSGATAAAAPCEVAAPRTAKPRAPAERAPRPHPTSATPLRAVSQFTPPPPPPAHSTAGGKVAPGAAPCLRTISSPTPPPHARAPLSACALTRCSARNHWRALRWGCCVPILQAGQLRRMSRVLAQS